MFKVGDKVSFLNEEGGGVVKAVSGNIITVETEDGFDYEYVESDLVRAGGDYRIDQSDIDDKIKSELEEKRNETFYKKFNHLEKMNRSDQMEVDLHIEKLISSYRGMTNYQIVEVQMANFRRSMNTAINRKLKRVVFIHGVGAGVLREEIRAELRAYYPQFEYLDGPYDRYGAGATEVVLRG